MPSRSTRCAASCRRRRCRTSGSTGRAKSYEQLLLRMRAHPLPEARSYADLMLTELRKVIPSFLQRVDVAERGGEWSAYLASNREQTGAVVDRLWPDLAEPVPGVAGQARFGRGQRRSGAARLRPGRGGESPGRGLLLPTGLLGARGGATGPAASDTTTAWPCCGPTSVIVGTADTGRAVASSGRTTGSNSSPTTARSATCNAIAC